MGRTNCSHESQASEPPRYMPHDICNDLLRTTKIAGSLPLSPKTYTRTIDTSYCTKQQGLLASAEPRRHHTHQRPLFASLFRPEAAFAALQSQPPVRGAGRQTNQPGLGSRTAARSPPQPKPDHIALLVTHKSFALCSCIVLH